MRRRRTLGGGYNPLLAFAGGINGVWYDPSDLSTMFTDSAGTIPVTGAGDSVLKILDKSGNANHATQSTSSSAPTLQKTASGNWYLDFSTDDSVATSAIDFSAINAVTTFFAMTRESDSAAGVLFEFSTNLNSFTDGFGVFAPAGANTVVSATLKGGNGYASAEYTDDAAPSTGVYTIGFNKSLSTNEVSPFRKNGSAASVTRPTNTNNSNNFGNRALYIGRRGGSTLPFDGRMFGLIIAGKVSSSEEISNMEKWLAAKSGVTL